MRWEEIEVISQYTTASGAEVLVTVILYFVHITSTSVDGLVYGFEH